MVRGLILPGDGKVRVVESDRLASGGGVALRDLASEIPAFPDLDPGRETPHFGVSRGAHYVRGRVSGSPGIAVLSECSRDGQRERRSRERSKSGANGSDSESVRVRRVPTVTGFSGTHGNPAFLAPRDDPLSRSCVDRQPQRTESDLDRHRHTPQNRSESIEHEL